MKHIDGHEITKRKARFSGTWDIEDPEAESLLLDRMVVSLVVSRTEYGPVKILDDGEVQATHILKPQDHMVLTGELREQAIAFMMHGPGAGIMSFDNYVHSAQSNAADSNGAAPQPERELRPSDHPGQGAIDFDPDTGEIIMEPFEDDPDFFDVPVDKTPEPETEGTVVVGHVSSPIESIRQDAPADDSPKVGKVPDEQSQWAPPSSAQRVGSVRLGARRDETLAAFLAE